VSDMQTGAHAPGGSDSTARQVAGQTADAAGRAASDVKETAKDQTQRVAGEAQAQARNVASQVRDRVGEQARTQNEKLVETMRRVADDLDEMRGERPDSPATTVVSRVAEGSRQLADHFARQGPEGVLREVQDFARRRPGAFLATALAAGFVVGRLGKGVAKASDLTEQDKPRTDTFAAGYDTPGYPTPGYVEPAYAASDAGTTYPADTGYTTGVSTEYAATGTGTPVPVTPTYVDEMTEPAPEYRSEPR
jgi:hypothetical protein